MWEMFPGNSFLSAILDRQGLMVAAPKDVRTKKAVKMRNPKIVVMSQTVTNKNFGQKVIRKQNRLCLAVAECQILDGKHDKNFGTTIMKYLVFEKGTIPSENYNCHWTLHRGNKPNCFL